MEAQILNIKNYRNNFLKKIHFIHNCSTLNKELLLHYLKLIDSNKFILVTGERFIDCYSMELADFGVSVNPKQAIIRRSSQIQITNISYLIECLQYGRCILVNVRRFLLYQTTIALNLAIFIGIGQFRFKEQPLSPSTILWLNFIMDLMAGIIFGSYLPDHNNPRITPRPDNEQES